ncbi:hypothetical protein SAMN04488135_109122 [Pollutimonas bauzanensis]|uniref:Uncharacterized protein n=2 Tax=Pollutimonas bauzanensis TaxID=658167 RepID=A0A1M5YIF3_9BURK|nr:hypothetical protein SAMN04488135_109122 [Pollutimonas bauzanensis]
MTSSTQDIAGMEAAEPLVIATEQQLPLIALSPTQSGAGHPGAARPQEPLITYGGWLILIMVVIASYLHRRITKSQLAARRRFESESVTSSDWHGVSDYSVANAVHSRVNGRLYQRRLKAYEHALAMKGYRVTPQTGTESGYRRPPYEVQRYAAEQIAREDIAYLYPRLNDEDIERYVRDRVYEGAALCFVEDLVASLIDEGFMFEPSRIVPAPELNEMQGAPADSASSGCPK